jgi:hypothetical protein
VKHGSIDSVCLRTAAAEFLGEHRPELQYLSPHRLVGDIHTALSEQIFAIARREAPLQPNGMPNDRRWELMWATKPPLAHRRRDKASQAVKAALRAAGHSRTARSRFLNGRAGQIPERTEYTTIAGLGFQQRIAVVTFIEILASVGGHRFGSLMPADRTGDRRNQFHREHGVLSSSAWRDSPHQ